MKDDHVPAIMQALLTTLCLLILFGMNTAQDLKIKELERQVNALQSTTVNATDMACSAKDVVSEWANTRDEVEQFLFAQDDLVRKRERRARLQEEYWEALHKGERHFMAWLKGTSVDDVELLFGGD